MPNPAQFKGPGAQKRFMEECMKRTKQEGKDNEQSVAQCLNMWRSEKGGLKKPPKKKAVADILRIMAQ